MKSGIYSSFQCSDRWNPSYLSFRLFIQYTYDIICVLNFFIYYPLTHFPVGFTITLIYGIVMRIHENLFIQYFISFSKTSPLSIQQSSVKCIHLVKLEFRLEIHGNRWVFILWRQSLICVSVWHFEQPSINRNYNGNFRIFLSRANRFLLIQQSSFNIMQFIKNVGAPTSI